MNPPNPFRKHKNPGHSLCIGCQKWRPNNQVFHAEGTHWVLCEVDFYDYWENMDEVPEDYYWYNVGV